MSKGRRAAVAVVELALALGIAACGGSDEGGHEAPPRGRS